MTGDFSYRLGALLMCALFSQAAFASQSSVVPGHSGMWFDPLRSGEGLVLEVFSDSQALMYWYTYDEAGNQRWLLGVGEVTEGKPGNEIVFPELLVTEGGRFGPDFDPADVVATVVGSAMVRFDDCNTATFEYQAFGQAQAIDVQRLSRVMAANCAPIHGIPGDVTDSHAGQSGSWYDPEHNGEGFSFHWMPNGEALLTWYTYDAEGNQAWVVGVGALEDGHLVFADLNSTRGAQFGHAFNPDDVEVVPWGSLSFELTCDDGIASYDSTIDSFGSGQQSIDRITSIHQLGCPWERPGFTDLYDVTWQEIPIEVDGPLTNNNVDAQSIADDGTVAAIEYGLDEAWIWRPATESWQIIPGQLQRNPVLISPADEFLVANQDNEPVPNVPYAPMMWREETGWQAIDGTIFNQSAARAASESRQVLVGVGRLAPPDNSGLYPWVWTASAGQIELPLTEEIPGATPVATSEDGERILGYTLLFDELTGLPRTKAVQWIGGAEPGTLRDELGVILGQPTTCSSDCMIFFGAGQAENLPDHPFFEQAWYRNELIGKTEYLGEIEGTVLAFGNRPYFPVDTSADGSIVVGSYVRLDQFGISLESRAFIWTPMTGIVSVVDLVEQLGIGDDNWSSMGAEGISSNGNLILLSGMGIKPAPGLLQRRATVLKLTEK